MYPHDPTGPSLDSSTTSDPAWDIPSEETPPDWESKALDVLAMLGWIAGVCVIGGMFVLAVTDFVSGG